MKAISTLLFICFLLFSCQPEQTLEIPALIPQPVSVVAGEGVFELNKSTKIVLAEDNEEIKFMAQQFAKHLSLPLGFTMETTVGNTSDNSIQLDIKNQDNPDENNEAYELKVLKKGIKISASSKAGLFYGLQTLVQLLPPDIENLNNKTRSEWLIPAVEINDYPRFPWRGLMLDVSRHFFSKEQVLAYIDQMVKYKFNVLHLHLSDDQGWRIEIKKYPKLTDIGAWRVPRQGTWWTFDAPKAGEKATQGGFYTQEDIKEMVKYAAERQVTILPEIDIPGHSLAMIAAYPELSNTGIKYPVNPGSRFYTIDDNTLDPSNEKVYEMLDNIFTEIAELFPSEYIHIGGDECYKGFWRKNPNCLTLMKKEGLKDAKELQSYFIKRIEQILIAKNKKLIGWDEILEGGLAPEATVMSWRGMNGGIAAAKMGHKVVMTPTHHCYLDLYQGDPAIEPQTYSMLRLRDCYNFEPVPEGVDPLLVLGGQGNLWTESVVTLRHAEYMTWPRSLALAEVLWTPKDNKDWNGFIPRMEEHFVRFDLADIKYARSAFDPIITITPENGKHFVEIETEIEGLDIFYSFDESYPDQFYPKYEEGIIFPPGAGSIRVVTYRDGEQIGKEIRREIEKK